MQYPGTVTFVLLRKTNWGLLICVPLWTPKKFFFFAKQLKSNGLRFISSEQSGSTMLNDSVHRKLARKICQATSLVERRKYATQLSIHLDRDSGWQAPVKMTNKSFQQRKSAPSSANIENMNPIESRRMIKKAVKDLEQRTVLRLKEDRTTKAILRARGTLRPQYDAHKKDDDNS